MHTRRGTIFASLFERGMRHLMTIKRLAGTPRAGLELLWAPVFLAPLPRSAGRANVERLGAGPNGRRSIGSVEGVVLDAAGRVRFFVVDVEAEERRVLVPPAAIDLGDDGLQVRWTLEQLHAQPSFVDDALLPRVESGEATPPEPRWMPARPSIVPPGPRTNRPAAIRGAALGAGVGAAAGLLIGLAAGGPALALAGALFLGAGGGLAGAIAGASRETAADAAALDAKDGHLRQSPRILALEQRLRERRPLDERVLSATPIVPASEVAAILDKAS